jgi:hypothetical protein
MMWRFLPVVLVLVTSAVGLHAADPETFTGTASATGTFKRLLLIVDDKRYESKAAEKAAGSLSGTQRSLRTSVGHAESKSSLVVARSSVTARSC